MEELKNILTQKEEKIKEIKEINIIIDKDTNLEKKLELIKNKEKFLTKKIEILEILQNTMNINYIYNIKKQLA